MKIQVAALLTVLSLPAWAQDKPAPAGGIPEPKVTLNVIDDQNAHIEELSVRGHTQRIVVTPKGGAARYEIITGDGSRDLSPGVNTTRDAAGKRVWNVLNF